MKDISRYEEKLRNFYEMTRLAEKKIEIAYNIGWDV